jgi:hypothetical protein
MCPTLPICGPVTEGKSWNEFARSPRYLVEAVRGHFDLGAVMLIYAGTQPPFDPIILPLFPDLPTPLNWLTNPLIWPLRSRLAGLPARPPFKGPPVGDMIARRQAKLRPRKKPSVKPPDGKHSIAPRGKPRGRSLFVMRGDPPCRAC